MHVAGKGSKLRILASAAIKIALYGMQIATGVSQNIIVDQNDKMKSCKRTEHKHPRHIYLLFTTFPRMSFNS